MSSDAVDRTLASPAPSEDDRARPTVINAQTRPRLLIADDDPVLRATLAGLLSNAFDVVGMAEDGESAVETARRERPDAALVDVEMPAGGGLNATRGIRAASPGTAVVILSADESSETFVACLKAGAMSYVRKGAAPHLIVEQLQESLALTRQIGQSLRRLDGLPSVQWANPTQGSDPPDAGS
jgi:DNA-binding NarL/FixJ family response regulator